MDIESQFSHSDLLLTERTCRICKTTKNLIEDYGHICILRDIVKDEPTKLLLILNKWINNKNLDVIITSGGTGLTGRDITVAVLETFFDKKIDGFG